MTCCFNPPGAPRATAQRRGAQNERTLYFAHDTKEAPTFLPPLPFIFSGTSWHFAKSFYLASAHVPVANVERALDREVPEALGEDVIPDVITSSVAPRVWAPVRGHPWGASTSGATLFPGRRAKAAMACTQRGMFTCLPWREVSFWTVVFIFALTQTSEATHEVKNQGWDENG